MKCLAVRKLTDFQCHDDCLGRLIELINGDRYFFVSNWHCCCCLDLSNLLSTSASWQTHTRVCTELLVIGAREVVCFTYAQNYI